MVAPERRAHARPPQPRWWWQWEGGGGGERLQSGGPYGPVRAEPPRLVLDPAPGPTPDSAGTAVSGRSGFKGGGDITVPS